MTTFTAAKEEGFADWHVFDDEGRSIRNYGKGADAARDANLYAYFRNGGLRASLEASIEYQDTLAAYDYLAEWEAGAHRGGDDNGPILRLRRSHRVPQTQE